MLQVLRLPLFMLPQLISQLVNAQVAISRLEEFLVAEEQEPLPQKPAPEQGDPPLPGIPRLPAHVPRASSTACKAAVVPL